MVSDFDAIYQEYGKTVYCFLLSLSRDETLSEELTQETMFRAIMNISSFRGDSKISVWLCQIAKKMCIYGKVYHRVMNFSIFFAARSRTVKNRHFTGR